MKKIILSLMAMILLSSSPVGGVGERNTEILTQQTADVKLSMYHRRELNEKIMKQQQERIEKTQRPEYKLISGLPKELLDYIYDYCETNDLSYSLVMSIAKVESNFDPKVVSKTHDYGLYQIHKPNIKWLSELAGIENVNPLDPKTNFLLAAAYLKYLRDYWSTYGLSEEQKFAYVVVSYNLGVEGAKNYVRKHGLKNNSYLKKIQKAKADIEQSYVEEAA